MFPRITAVNRCSTSRLSTPHRLSRRNHSTEPVRTLNFLHQELYLYGRTISDEIGHYCQKLDREVNLLSQSLEHERLHNEQLREECSYRQSVNGKLWENFWSMLEERDRQRETISKLVRQVLEMQDLRMQEKTRKEYADYLSDDNDTEGILSIKVFLRSSQNIKDV